MSYRFDPELAALIPLIPVRDADDIRASREQLEAMSRTWAADLDLSGLTVEDRSVPGPSDAPDVDVRLYRPEPVTATVPGLLYIHGGAFVVGSINTEHAQAADIARSLGIIVLSVNYRLAPEDPFPAGLEDCYAALLWFFDHAGELGLDTSRLGVLGQSAGGGLAAALALLARDRTGPALCFQFLGIPELDDRLETSSMRQFTDTPMWDRAKAILSWDRYLGEDRHDVSPYAAPARASDLSGLPPAYISTMEFDPLRDEGIAYGLRLLEAGVTVELHSFPGTFHGSGAFAQTAISQRIRDEQLTVLRRGLSA